MPMRIPARPLSIRCWPKLISQNGTQLPASEMATLNSQIAESTESVDAAARPGAVRSTAAMISLIVTSAVGLKPRTAMPVNMKALPHIATRGEQQQPVAERTGHRSSSVGSAHAARLAWSMITPTATTLAASTRRVPNGSRRSRCRSTRR